MNRLEPAVLEVQAGVEVLGGFELIESQKLKPLLVLAAEENRKRRVKDQRLAEGKSIIGRPPWEATHGDRGAAI